MTRLSTLDLVLSVVDRADFAVILRLKKTPPLEALRAGARSARTLYPVTGSLIDGKYWKPAPIPADGVVEAAAAKDPDREVEKFLDCPFDPHDEMPIRQLVAPGRIVTRVHHAAADGFSAGLWLRHQLRVAAGIERPAGGADPAGPVRLRDFRRHVTNKSVAPSSPPGWTRDRQGTSARRWLTCELPGTISSDALAGAVLGTIAEWNRMHGAPADGISLWLPVNIRKRGSAQFGNGTSRIRVRLNGDSDIQRQIHRGLRNGEWVVPANPWLARLPLAIGAPLVRLYVYRPWADMGSVAFSHIAGWASQDDRVFEEVEPIEVVGQLHHRLPLAINAVTHRGRTWMTFTFDPARFTGEDVSWLAQGTLSRVREGIGTLRIIRKSGAVIDGPYSGSPVQFPRIPRIRWADQEV